MHFVVDAVAVYSVAGGDGVVAVVAAERDDVLDASPVVCSSNQ
jgi:hypothetical protein